MFLRFHFENVIKDQVTLNEHSIGVTGRTFFITLMEPCQNISPSSENASVKTCENDTGTASSFLL